MGQSIDMKDVVRQAVQSQWPGFAERHPRLAAVLDQDLVIASAIESMADDAEYQEAMATAQAVGAGANVIADVVTHFVARWIRQLV